MLTQKWRPRKWHGKDMFESGNFFFFFTLVTGPRRSVSLKLSDTRVCEPQMRARLGTTAHLCEVVVLNPETPTPEVEAAQVARQGHVRER